MRIHTTTRYVALQKNIENEETDENLMHQLQLQRGILMKKFFK